MSYLLRSHDDNFHQNLPNSFMVGVRIFRIRVGVGTKLRGMDVVVAEEY